MIIVFSKKQCTEKLKDECIIPYFITKLLLFLEIIKLVTFDCLSCVLQKSDGSTLEPAASASYCDVLYAL
jgi:hypothetical protein